MNKFVVVTIALALAFALAAPAVADPLLLQMEVTAKDRYERTDLADAGATFLHVRGDKSLILGTQETLDAIVAMGFDVDLFGAITDFPPADEDYHNYQEMLTEMQNAASDHSNIAALQSIGNTLLGSPVWGLKVTDNPGQNEGEPEILLVGLHHAREHLTVEVVLGIIEALTDDYGTDPDITDMVNENVIWLVPMLNVDGGEYDIATGSYRWWRKNRRDNGNGTYGVDLNRNYSQFWGGPGSSGTPSSETYRGPSAFSEPETQVIQSFFENHDVALTISYHSYGELVLYPNNGSYDPIADPTDLQVHELIGEEMGDITGYTDQPGNQLYLSAGEYCDWSYHVMGSVCFTIELPTNTFYPGDEIIPSVVAENLEAALFAMDYADDPTRIIWEQPFVVSPMSGNVEIGGTLDIDASGGVPPYTFQVTNSQAAAISGNGVLSGIALGTTQVIVRDSDGRMVTTGSFEVVEATPGVCGVTGTGGGLLALVLIALSCVFALRKRTA